MTVTVGQVRAEPHRYGLPAYPWATAERAAELFNRWEAGRGKPSPPLCSRCGMVLRFADPGQQLHPWCDPNHPLNQPPASCQTSRLPCKVKIPTDREHYEGTTT